MKIKSFFPVALALLAGAALGFVLAPSAAPAAKEEPVQEQGRERAQQPRERQGGGDRSEARRLRARIKELEELLEKQGVEFEKMKEEDEAARRERPRFDPRAEMERLQREDPARYAQMTNGMAQFRQRRLERAQSKMDFLASVDTSRMSPEARRTHVELQEMIEKRELLEDRMRNFLDMSDDERRAAFDEMRETDGRIRELNRAERENLLVQTAETLGFQGEDAKEIADTVKGIYEATENGWGGRGGPGGFGGRGGPVGQGGRGGRGGRGGGR